MAVLVTLLLLAALVLLLLAAFNVAVSPRFSAGWLGLAFMVLVFVIERGLFG